MVERLILELQNPNSLKRLRLSISLFRKILMEEEVDVIVIEIMVGGIVVKEIIIEVVGRDVVEVGVIATTTKIEVIVIVKIRIEVKVAMVMSGVPNNRKAIVNMIVGEMIVVKNIRTLKIVNNKIKMTNLKIIGI